MSGQLFDTNVLLDIATADVEWLRWSEEQLRQASSLGPILINPIVYAELAPAFASQRELDHWLDPASFCGSHCPTPQGGLPRRRS